MSDRQRVSFLTMSQYRLLDDWGHTLTDAFHQWPYLVGSALVRSDFRDVDVRIMLADAAYDALAVEPMWLNLAISLWGERVTGLPIDFQVQRTSEANRDHNGVRRPLGLLAEEDK